MVKGGFCHILTSYQCGFRNAALMQPYIMMSVWLGRKKKSTKYSILLKGLVAYFHILDNLLVVPSSTSNALARDMISLHKSVSKV
jgi:hypothetical protein